MSARPPALLLLAALALSAPATARAQAQPPPPPFLPKTATFSWSTTSLRVSVSFREIINEDVVKKLNSGIPTTIAASLGVLENSAKEGSHPVEGTLRTCRVTYDVWDEVYQVVQSSQVGNKTSIVPTLDGVLNRCAMINEKFIVASRSRLKVGASYRVEGKVEVNPIDPALMERIRQWVSRPKGSATVGAGDSLFGSFVGLFVSKIDSADRTIRFKTQPVVVPAPPPPPKE